MRTLDVCENYFNGFSEICNFVNNDHATNALAALKIVSYFTVVIPLAFAAVYVADSLCGRVSAIGGLSSHERKVNTRAQERLNIAQIVQTPDSKIVQTPDSKMVRNYTGDLTESEKTQLRATAGVDGRSLEINVPERSDLVIAVRCQNIFGSGAEVIVNAANPHLGGGRGIDGLIHLNGGKIYEKAHQQLQRSYDSKYIRGHAAMISSGSLQEKYQIQNVIVVAGPQWNEGQRNADPKQGEKELYSCYYNSLMLAAHQGKKSIAFPSISTGIYHFPKNRAASISLKAIFDFVTRYPDTSIKKISIHFMPDEREAIGPYLEALRF